MQYKSLLLTSLLAFGTGAHVQHFTNKDYTTGIQEGTWFVKYYTTWCEYSRQLAPIWIKLGQEIARNQTSNINLGEADCDESSGVCGTEKIRFLPTLKLFENGRFIEEYRGERSLEALRRYISSKTNGL